MSKTLKRVLITISILAIVIIGAFIFADYYVEKKITEKMQSLPEHIKISYDQIDVSLLNSDVTLTRPKVQVFSRQENKVNLEMELEQLRVVDLSYWDYLFNDAVSIDSIAFDSFKAVYRHDKRVRHKEYKKSVSERLSKYYAVNTIQFNNGVLEVIDDGADTLQLKTENLNLTLTQVELNNNTKDEKIPFALKNFELSADSLFFRLGANENMTVGSVDASLSHTDLKQVSLKTKYSKSEYDRMIEKERDHFDLEVDSITISDQDFGYVNDSTPYYKAGDIKITKPNFKIYRNKLIADDNTTKYLYSKMLRDLNLRLTLDQLNVRNGIIEYSELVKSGHAAGQLEFDQVSATIQKLSNTYPEGEQTFIHVESQFMDDAPLVVDWNFDVNNEADYFTFKGSVGAMPVNEINSFITPNQNIKLKGRLIKTYFNIEGNHSSSHIDFKIDYDNFEVVVLKKDGRNKNKFLSTVANIFVKKTSQKEEGDFRNGSKTSVERDQTKSVFNYVWINISAALKDAML